MLACLQTPDMSQLYVLYNMYHSINSITCIPCSDWHVRCPLFKTLTIQQTGLFYQLSEHFTAFFVVTLLIFFKVKHDLVQRTLGGQCWLGLWGQNLNTQYGHIRLLLKFINQFNLWILTLFWYWKQFVYTWWYKSKHTERQRNNSNLIKLISENELHLNGQLVINSPRKIHFWLYLKPKL